MSGRQFPVPAIDFTAISANLSTIKASAQSAGYYWPSSGTNGYKVLLKTDGTFNLYKVRSLLSTPSGCTNSLSQTGWGTWSINVIGSTEQTTLIGNYDLPTNGVMFFEDLGRRSDQSRSRDNSGRSISCECEHLQEYNRQ